MTKKLGHWVNLSGQPLSRNHVFEIFKVESILIYTSYQHGYLCLINCCNMFRQIYFFIINNSSKTGFFFTVDKNTFYPNFKIQAYTVSRENYIFFKFIVINFRRPERYDLNQSRVIPLMP